MPDSSGSHDEGRAFLQDFLSVLKAQAQANERLLQAQTQLNQNVSNLNARLDALAQRIDVLAQNSVHLYNQMGRLGTILIEDGDGSSHFQPPGEVLPTLGEVLGHGVEQLLNGQQRGGRRRRR